MNTMCILSYILLLYLTKYQCYKISTPKEAKLSSLNCLNQVVERHYNPGDMILVSGKNFALPFPVVHYDTKRVFTTFKVVEMKMGIIYLERTKNFGEIILKISQEQFFNPSAKFVVISKKISSKLIKVASKFYLTNVIFVKVVTNTLQTIYTYEPYQNENTSFTTKNYKYLASCNEGILSKIDLYPNHKPWKTWRNTTINVIYNVIPPYFKCPSCDDGIEAYLLDIVSKQLGFNVNYVNQKDFTYWGSKVNGAYTYILQKLYQRNCDMVLGGFHSKSEDHLDFDMTFTFISDGVYWLVPKAEKLSGWRTLKLLGCVETYIFLVVTLIVVPVLYHLLYKDSVLDYVFVLYQTLLESAIPRLPKRRIVYFHIVISFLTISTIVKGFLIHLLSVENYEHQISSLEDIVGSNLTIMIDHDIAQYFKNDNPLDKYVYETYQFCNAPRECINRTAYQKDVVTVDFKRSHEFQLPILYVNSEGKPLTYLFETPIFPLYIHWYFVKGFPIYKQIDEVLWRLKSSGIVEHLCHRISFKTKVDMNRKTGITSVTLGLNEMGTLFVLNSCGHVLALIVFLLELCIGFCKKITCIVN